MTINNENTQEVTATETPKTVCLYLDAKGKLTPATLKAIDAQFKATAELESAFQTIGQRNQKLVDLGIDSGTKYREVLSMRSTGTGKDKKALWPVSPKTGTVMAEKVADEAGLVSTEVMQSLNRFKSWLSTQKKKQERAPRTPKAEKVEKSVSEKKEEEKAKRVATVKIDDARAFTHLIKSGSKVDESRQAEYFAFLQSAAELLNMHEDQVDQLFHTAE